MSESSRQPHHTAADCSGEESASPSNTTSPPRSSLLDATLGLPPSCTTESSNCSSEDNIATSGRGTTAEDTAESTWPLNDLDVSLTGEKFNLFGDLSEEHLSQIESAVLSTEEGKQILQQQSSVKSPSAAESEQATAAVMEDEDGDALFLDDSLITEGLRGGHLVMDFAKSFSDHAYCAANSERSAEEGKENENFVREHKPTKDDEGSSQVKAGDEEEEQITSGRSPKGKLRPSRRSTRIQEHEQRTQAEKIRQENIQKEQEAMASIKAERKEYNMRTSRPVRDDGRVDYTKRRRGRKQNETTSDTGEVDDDEKDLNSTMDSVETLSDDNEEVSKEMTSSSRGRGPRQRGRKRGGKIATYSRRQQKKTEIKTDSDSEALSQEQRGSKTGMKPQEQDLSGTASSDDEDDMPLTSLQSKDTISIAEPASQEERKPILQNIFNKLQSQAASTECESKECSEGENSVAGSVDTDGKSDGDATRKSHRIQERIKQGKPPLKVSELFKVKAFESKGSGQDTPDTSESEASLDSTFDSDDDPEKLWCFCRQPFNKRFMICCDQCSEWYHGSCVGISKAKGKLMAKNNESWVCSACTKKEGRAKKSTVRVESDSSSDDDEADVGVAASKRQVSTSSRDSEDEMPLANLVTSKTNDPSHVKPPEEVKGKSTDTPMDHDADEDATEKMDTEAGCDADEELNSNKPDSISDKAESIEEEVQAIKDKIKEVKEKRVNKDKSSTGKTRVKDGDASSSIDNEKEPHEENEKSKKKSQESESKSEKEKPLKSKERCRGPECKHRAKLNSVFCSVDCITKHAKESLNLLEKERKKAFGGHSNKETESAVSDSSSTERIVVLERKSGKVLTGPAAPTRKTLLLWLEKHPTFEVLQPGQEAKSKSFYKKDSRREAESKAARDHDSKKSKARREALIRERLEKEREKAEKERLEKEQEQKQRDLIKRKKEEVAAKSAAAAASGSGPDPIRINVRKSLREMLIQRASNADDVMVSTMEIKSIALSIEEELFSFYSGVNSKYKHKFRALATQLKDNRNKGFFRKVLNAEIKPRRLVRMTSDQIGSQELAIWREEGLHKNVFELMELSKTEQPSPEKKSAPVPTKSQPVSIIKQSVKEEKKPELPYDPAADFLSSIIIDNTAQHGKHFFDVNCKICTGKVPMPTEPVKTEKTKTASYEVKKELTVNTDDTQSDTYQEKLPTPTYSTSELSRPADTLSPVDQSVTMSKPEIKSISLPDKKMSEKDAERKPLQTSQHEASAPAKDARVAITRKAVEKLATASPIKPLVPSPLKQDADIPTSTDVVWKGSIVAHDVAKFVTKSFHVSGNVDTLRKDLPGTISITGRLSPDTVFDYLSKLKASHGLSREMSLVRFEPASTADHTGYMLLYAFLSGRNRCGVVSRFGAGHPVKDVYIVPLSAQAKIPAIFLPFSGPGLPDDRSPALLGVFMKSKQSKISARDPRQKHVAAPTPDTGKPEVLQQQKIPKESIEKEAVSSNDSPAKTWMYSERSEFSAEEQAAQAEAQNKEASQDDEDEEDEEDDMEEDLEVCSEATRKDPIISKFSRPDPLQKMSIPKASPVIINDKDDNAEYEPESVPYDPSVLHEVTESDSETNTATDAPQPLSSWNDNLLNKTSAAAEDAVVSSSENNASPVTSILDQITKSQSSPAQMTAAMFAKLAASSSSKSIEEQKNLLAKLTAKIEEQKRLVEKQKAEALQRTQLFVQKTSNSESTSSTSNAQTSIPVQSSQSNPSLNVGSVNSQSKSEASKTDEPKLIPLERNSISDILDPDSFLELHSSAKAGPSSHQEPFPSTQADQSTSSESGVTSLPPALQQLLSGKNLENLKNIVASVSNSKPSALSGSGEAQKESNTNSEADSKLKVGDFSQPLPPPPKPLFLLESESTKTDQSAVPSETLPFAPVQVDQTPSKSSGEQTQSQLAEREERSRSDSRSRRHENDDVPFRSRRDRTYESGPYSQSRERRNGPRFSDTSRHRRRSPVWENRGNRYRRSRSRSPRRSYDRSRRRSPDRSRHHSRENRMRQRSRSRDRGTRRRSRDRSRGRSSRDSHRNGGKDKDNVDESRSQDRVKNDSRSQLSTDSTLKVNEVTESGKSSVVDDSCKRTESTATDANQKKLNKNDSKLQSSDTDKTDDSRKRKMSTDNQKEDPVVPDKVTKLDNEPAAQEIVKNVAIPFPIPPPLPPVPPQLLSSGMPIAPMPFPLPSAPKVMSDPDMISSMLRAIKSDSMKQGKLSESRGSKQPVPSMSKLPLLPTPEAVSSGGTKSKKSSSSPVKDHDMRHGPPVVGDLPAVFQDANDNMSDVLPAQDRDMRHGRPLVGADKNSNSAKSGREASRGKVQSSEATDSASRLGKMNRDQGKLTKGHIQGIPHQPGRGGLGQTAPDNELVSLIDNHRRQGNKQHLPEDGLRSGPGEMNHEGMPPWDEPPFRPRIPDIRELPMRPIGPRPPRLRPPLSRPPIFQRGRGGPPRGFPTRMPRWQGSRPDLSISADATKGDVDLRHPPAPPKKGGPGEDSWNKG